VRHTNTLIIGQGIAGSLVAFMLYRQHIPFIVVDAGHANTASRVAAGMFTPVSGKRKAIDIGILQQIPFAIDIYKQIEKLIGENILHLQDIYEVPASSEEQNELLKKSVNALFEKYIVQHQKKIPHIKQDFEAFKITNSGWVDCLSFINGFRDWLKQKDALIEEAFDYSLLKIDNENLRYKEIEFEKIIFCEGYQVFNNPFFNDEKIIPCKGDILTVEYKNDLADIIKKNGCYLIPYMNNVFKAGSTYHWNNNDETLFEIDKQAIETNLDKMLEDDYIVTNHQSAIRPTTHNREVIAKQHQQYSNMFMLNGLGTKGIIQGPLWAEYIVNMSIKSK
jgi:glycine oxidase